jgi:nucleoside-diphosphate-sugar epimerase
MIIGNGRLAKSIKNYDREDVVFIAAGVSDSKCTDKLQFQREREMVTKLVKEHADKVIVYFSTFSINDPVMAKSDYVATKLELEKYVLQHCKRCLIIRISNLVGTGGNPKNVFNYFYNQIVAGNRFSLWSKSQRNLIMVEDFADILNYIITHELETKINSVLNIVNVKSFTVQEIVGAIERYTGKKAHYDVIEIESVPHEVDEHSKIMFELLNIETENYLEKILKNHFAKFETVPGSQPVRVQAK